MSSAPSIPHSPFTIPGSSRDIVLAFSGGLDTSFCVPWLQERGWEVNMVFAATGSVDAEERAAREARAPWMGGGNNVPKGDRSARSDVGRERRRICKYRWCRS